MCENTKFYYISEEKFEDMLMIKKYHKVSDQSYYKGKYRGVAHRTCNLKYSIPKEITLSLKRNLLV